MDSMQAEAMRRVREMHSPPAQKAETTTRSAHGSADNSPAKQEHHPRDTEKQSAAMPESESASPCYKQRDEQLFADKEKFLILALIMILSSEEQSDPMLTLALLYLII